MNARVLLVHSDPERRRALGGGLRAQGFAVSAVALAAEALETCRRAPPDAVVIASDAPDREGLSLLAALRGIEDCRNAAAILAVAQDRVEPLLKAFALGADDCVAETVDVRELGARLVAALRRRTRRDAALTGAIRSGELRLDPAQRACWVGRKPIALRPREFDLLEILMRKPGRLLSRSYLLESVWGMHSEAATRAVDVAVSRLRRRLGPSGRRIETVLKGGYRLTRA